MSWSFYDANGKILQGILGGAVDTTELADDAVTSAKIATDAVIADGIAANAVGASELANDAVDTAAIANDAVTADKLADSINTEITANTAKVTNATHSGEVTGTTALTIAANAVTLAKMAHGTDGNLITYDTDGAPAYVATGANDQVLTSNGPDTVPTFQAAAGGGAMTLIQSTNVTSNTGSVDFTGLSGYATYFLQVSNAVPQNNGPYAVMQVGDSYGFDTSNQDYAWHHFGLRANASTPTYTHYPSSTDSSETTWILLFRRGVGSDTNEGFSCSIWIHNNGTQRTRIHGTFCASSHYEETSGGLVIGERVTNITMDRVRFKFHDGAVASGRISLYGVSHA